MKKLIISVVATFCLHLTHAQEFSSKYGDVSIDDLKMKAYPLDTTAGALILFHHVEVSVHVGTTVREHVRIKFFKKDSFEEWGNVTILAERGWLSRVKGTTYWLENNAIVKRDVSDQEIMKKRFSKTMDKTSFALPNLQEGCIVEYSYTVGHEAKMYPDFNFQTTIPTRTSEYIITSRSSDFRPELRGRLAPTLVENKDDGRYQRWVMKDIPAFKNEPYMPHNNVYLSSIRFVSTAWDKIVANLFNAASFGEIIRGNDELKKYAEEAIAGITEPQKKVKAISDYIKRNVRWDGDEDFLAYHPREVLAKKKGSSGDINLMLVAMLRRAGFSADPVLLSTRDHGFVIEDFPRMNQFNYVMCRVGVDGNYFLLDATEPDLPYDEIPVRCLNYKGLTISFDNATRGVSQWVEIPARTKNKTMVNANLSISANGQVSGKVDYSKYGYAAFDARQNFKALGEHQYKKEFLGIAKADRLIESSVKNIDDLEKPVVDSYTLSFDEDVVVSGDLIYFNPFVALKTTVNPFTSETREYPIDLVMPTENAMVCSITIPDGYIVDQLPTSKIVAMPEDAARCVFNISTAGNKIIVSTRLFINRTIFVVEEYAALREFYTRLMSKQQEQIVIKKK